MSALLQYNSSEQLPGVAVEGVCAVRVAGRHGHSIAADSGKAALSFPGPERTVMQLGDRVLVYKSVEEDEIGGTGSLSLLAQRTPK